MVCPPAGTVFRLLRKCSSDLLGAAVGTLQSERSQTEKGDCRRLPLDECPEQVHPKRQQSTADGGHQGSLPEGVRVWGWMVTVGA